MKNIVRILKALWNSPKTIYLNFVTLPFAQAIHFPIIVMNRTKLTGLQKNSIVIQSPVHMGMILVGVDKTVAARKTGGVINRLSLRNGAVLIFDGEASFGNGISIVMGGGRMHFGRLFSCNESCLLSCSTSFVFGTDVLLGWNVSIRDNDGHKIYDLDGNITNPAAGVKIGNHVWIGANVDILKGNDVANGVIIGYRSLVTKPIREENTIAAGVPAKIIKKNIRWEH